jgi:hypothetical protein
VGKQPNINKQKSFFKSLLHKFWKFTAYFNTNFTKSER